MRFTTILGHLALFSILSVFASPTQAASVWPQWDEFTKRFLQADGRVVDITFERKSTSEGQSYALFFALVANRRDQFDTILKWTSDNLAAGQLGDKLPGWLWGVRQDGSWGLKDANAAADADLWIAYSLFEAARLWKEPSYARIAQKLLTQIKRHEVVQAGSAGPVLLPGPVGFVLDKGRYRINPSYLPEFMFRYLAMVDSQGPWKSIWAGYMRMAPKIFQAGIAPDQFVVDAQGVVMPDTESTPSASYDGIRVYLWAGMSKPANQELLERLAPYANLTRKLGAPPEKVDPLSAKVVKADYSPTGFSGALLPYLSAIGDQATRDKLRNKIRNAAMRARFGEATNYYDQVLILFGAGWLDGQYRFDEQGRVHPKWAD